MDKFTKIKIMRMKIKKKNAHEYMILDSEEHVFHTFYLFDGIVTKERLKQEIYVFEKLKWIHDKAPELMRAWH